MPYECEKEESLASEEGHTAAAADGRAPDAVGGVVRGARDFDARSASSGGLARLEAWRTVDFDGGAERSVVGRVHERVGDARVRGSAADWASCWRG